MPEMSRHEWVGQMVQAPSCQLLWWKHGPEETFWGHFQLAILYFFNGPPHINLKCFDNALLHLQCIASWYLLGYSDSGNLPCSLMNFQANIFLLDSHCHIVVYQHKVLNRLRFILPKKQQIRQKTSDWHVNWPVITVDHQFDVLALLIQNYMDVLKSA